MLYIKSPELIYLTTESLAELFLKAIEENPFPSFFQFLETTHIPKLVTPFSVLKPAILNLSDFYSHISLWFSFVSLFYL